MAIPMCSKKGGGGGRVEILYRRFGVRGPGWKGDMLITYPREPNAATDRVRNTMDIAHPI